MRNGMSGTWGLREMAALLRPAGATAAATSTVAGPAAKKMPGGAAAPVPHVASVLPAAVNGAAGNGSAVNGVGQRVPGSAAAGPMLVGPRGAGAAAGAMSGAGVSMAAAGAMVGSPERLGAASSGAAGRPVAAAARPMVESGRAAVPSYAPAAVASALGSGEEADRLPTRRASLAERVAAERDSLAQGRWPATLTGSAGGAGCHSAAGIGDLVFCARQCGEADGNGADDGSGGASRCEAICGKCGGQHDGGGAAVCADAGSSAGCRRPNCGACRLLRARQRQERRGAWSPTHTCGRSRRRAR